jgi:hypothetical protein
MPKLAAIDIGGTKIPALVHRDGVQLASIMLPLMRI